MPARWLLGVDFAPFWGVLFFLLNYLPNIGSIIAGISPTILAFVQLGFGWGLLAAGGLLIMEQIIGNFLDPRLQGRTLDVSSLMVLLSVIFWGWIWGIPGALIAVPLTVTPDPHLCEYHSSPADRGAAERGGERRPARPTPRLINRAAPPRGRVMLSLGARPSVTHDRQVCDPAFDHMTSPAALIGLDWGTTSFRAYRIGADGDLIEGRSAPAGILKVAAGEFEQVLEREIGPWLADGAELPVLASGMITSRQGWVEVPYCPCPAGSAEIAGALLRHETKRGRTIHFVPGLSIVGADGVPDVIRGEETQIIGAIGGAPGRRLLVLPGTHSKWALVEDGRLVWFATFMTGELFAVLKEHSILGRMMAGHSDDEDAFRRGLAYARGTGGGLLRRLFSARTLALFGELPERATASYLSGLLIGSELREAMDCLEQAPLDREITVIGDAELCRRYLAAIAAAGLLGRRAAEDAGARGLFLIARAAGLIR